MIATFFHGFTRKFEMRSVVRKSLPAGDITSSMDEPQKISIFSWHSRVALVRLQHPSFGGPWGNLWDLSFDFVTDWVLIVSLKFNLFELAEFIPSTEFTELTEFTEFTESVLAGEVTEMHLDNP